MSEEQPSVLQPKKVKTLAESLWFPALFFIGFIVCYMIPFHAPEPHDVKVAVSGPVAAAQIQAGLEDEAPGAFDIMPVKDADEARDQVENRDASAAFSVEGDHATLYVAKSNGMMLESTVNSVFTPIAEKQGADLRTVDLSPTAGGDVTGTSLFYLAMVWNIVPYIAVMMLMRATSLSRREKLTTITATGAVASVVGYFVALGLDIIPHQPLAMVYGFVLTQAVAWTVYGLVPFVRHYIPGVAITLFVLLSIPSSGGAIPYQMVPGFFRWLHPVMPLGNFIDAAHGLFYFDGTGLLRPTIVLLVWLAVGVALTVFGALRQNRKKAAAEAGGQESAALEAEEEATIEDPAIEAPLPHPVRNGGARGEVPTLHGQVTGADGTTVAGAMVTITDGRGRHLVRTHTDPAGCYAVTGLPEIFVNVLLTAPDMLPAVARVLPDSSHPQRWDFVMNDARHRSAASATQSSR
ncbi:carboxypeptidase regulatory-like domain-containing protein [Streptomyces sp. NPDC016469]|uniref:carboxypeptidase regulatory-like domain-containing protein n=1 Tax=Streptomyces sp. NPDC016469 TaxID=3157191 RepID=UPI0033D7BDDC